VKGEKESETILNWIGEGEGEGGGGVGLATLHVSALGGAEVTESGRRSSTRSAGR